MTRQPKSCLLATTTAAQFREARLARGWSQSDLAAKADIAHSTVSVLESGHRSLTFRMAERLAAALGIRIEVRLLTEPCGTCGGNPPAGFTCRACGASTAADGGTG